MSKGGSGVFKGTSGDKTSSTPVSNHLPSNDSQLKHIFRNASGHLPDTPENRELIESIANDPAYYYGVDGRGLTWFSKINPDGTQIWISIRNGKIQNAGKNETKHEWDPETGFSRNIKKDPDKNNWRRAE